MKPKVSILTLAIMGLLPMMAFGQNLRMVGIDTIHGEDISPGLKDIYSTKLEICGNTDYPDLFNLVYLCSGNDSFQINLYRMHKRKARALSRFRIRNAVPREITEAKEFFGFYRIYAQGSRLYIHYGRYITELSFSPQFDRIDTIRHLDVKGFLDHIFLYFYPVGTNGSSFIGIRPEMFDVCPAEPEVDIIPVLVQRSGDSLYEHSHYFPLPKFETEFWIYFDYNPIMSDSRNIYVMSPLTQRLSRFDVENGRWQSIALHGIEAFTNNYDCQDSVRKATNNNWNALFRSCYPRNFYYKFIYANASSLYLLRYYLSTDSAIYYIDEFHLDSPASASYQGSLCLNQISVTDASGKVVPWSPRSIMLAPIFFNDKYFCRVLSVDDVNSEVLPEGETENTLVLEIFYLR